MTLLHRDLRQSASSDIDIDEFRRTMDRYAVCVIRNEKPVTDAEHVEFSRRLGPLLPMKMLDHGREIEVALRPPRAHHIGNIDAEGRLLPEDDRRRAYNRGNLLWHTDASYDQARGVYSLLSCHSIPPGGADTEFADTRAAYDSLPEETKKRIENLVVEHSIWHSRALGGMTDVSERRRRPARPARHQLVHLHPGSGRKVLYLASHASHVVGMAALEEGRAAAARADRVRDAAAASSTATVALGDLLVWDNLADHAPRHAVRRHEVSARHAPHHGGRGSSRREAQAAQQPRGGQLPLGGAPGAVAGARASPTRTWQKPKIAVVNTSSELASCFSHLDGDRARC